MTWKYKVYVVWVFSDKTAYPLGTTEWDICWAATLDLRPIILGPAEYFWQSHPGSGNNVSNQFHRTNVEPVLNLPTAKAALISPGGFQ